MDSVAVATERLLSRVLPQKQAIEYAPRRIIYDQVQPSMGIYRIISGRVKVCLSTAGAGQVVLGIYSADQFFGQSGMLHEPHWHERALAIEQVSLSCWTIDEIETADPSQATAGPLPLSRSLRALAGITRAAGEFRAG